MSEIKRIKNDFLKAGYTEEESIVLAEQVTKFKSIVTDITAEEATEYLKQSYDTLKL